MPNVDTHLNYRNTAMHETGVISDLWNTAKVKELHTHKGWFTTSKYDLGLVLGTDGGALFKRTGVQAWPVFALIANLPPAER